MIALLDSSFHLLRRKFKDGSPFPIMQRGEERELVIIRRPSATIYCRICTTSRFLIYLGNLFLFVSLLCISYETIFTIRRKATHHPCRQWDESHGWESSLIQWTNSFWIQLRSFWVAMASEGHSLSQGTLQARRSSSGQCNSHAVQEGLGRNTRWRLEGCWKSPKEEARTDAEF